MMQDSLEIKALVNAIFSQNEHSSSSNTAPLQIAEAIRYLEEVQALLAKFHALKHDRTQIEKERNVAQNQLIKVCSDCANLDTTIFQQEERINELALILERATFSADGGAEAKLKLAHSVDNLAVENLRLREAIAQTKKEVSAMVEAKYVLDAQLQ